MELTWGIAAIWLGLALVASLLSIRFKMSVALVEILVGIAAGNLVLLLDHYHVFGRHWELKPNEWIVFLAGFGSILLTFMAGAEIEPALFRKYFKETFTIGIAGFIGPFIGATLYAHFVSAWDWNASLICGIALSTTSVAVVYAVMVETGLNETELGKIILAACFINDLGTVVALGACFASYNWTLGVFAAVAVVVLWVAPRFVAWFLNRFSSHVSEPGVKFVFFVLFAPRAAGRIGKVRGRASRIPRGTGAGGRLCTPSRYRPAIADHRVRIAHPVLFPQRGHESLLARTMGRSRAGRCSLGGQDGHQGRRHLAVDAPVRIRAARGQLYHAVDVHGPDLRHHQRLVWIEPRLHQPIPILDPRDGGDRQRRCADDDCPNLVQAPDRDARGLPEQLAGNLEPAAGGVWPTFFP